MVHRFEPSLVEYAGSTVTDDGRRWVVRFVHPPEPELALSIPVDEISAILGGAAVALAVGSDAMSMAQKYGASLRVDSCEVGAARRDGEHVTIRFFTPQGGKLSFLCSKDIGLQLSELLISAF